MVTTVGTEDTHEDLVLALLELEHDALAAYGAAIGRLEDPTLVAQMRDFRADHERHVASLSEVTASLGLKMPDGSMKSVLTSGKVVLAELAGDRAILHAMRTNEEDTVTAYQRASESTCASEATLATSREAHADELRHRAWMERTADALGKAN